VWQGKAGLNGGVKKNPPEYNRGDGQKSEYTVLSLDDAEEVNSLDAVRW